MFGKFTPEKYEEAKETGDTPKVEKLQEKANAENERNIQKYNSMRYKIRDLVEEAKMFRQEHLLYIPAEGFIKEYPSRAYARGEGVDIRGAQDRRLEDALEELLPAIGNEHELRNREERVSDWRENVAKSKEELERRKQSDKEEKERQDSLKKVREDIKNTNE